MPASRTCRRVQPHCRALSTGKTAKEGKACTKTTKTGARKSGTQIRGFYSPKARCGSAAVRIQAAARALSARKKASASSSSSSSRKRKSGGGGGTSRKKLLRVSKPRTRLIEQM